MTKSLIRKRREAGAICSICRSPDYKMEKENPIPGMRWKPTFICKQCGHTWQFGYDGGVYSQLAKERF